MISVPKSPPAGQIFRQEPGIPPAGQICLFLDIDGTLVEFADTPDGVCFDPPLLDVLRRLDSVLGGALALVSGRPIADIDRLLDPLRLPLAGLHGVERRDAVGHLHTPEVDASELESVRSQLERFVASHPGLLLEDKACALAVHYRKAPDLRNEVWTAMSKAAAGLAPEFKLLEGDKVLELKPGRRDKASAVEDFMREIPFRGRVPVFVGDDVTDYDGFSAVRRHSGITIAVGTRVTAQWYLRDPQAVREWLVRIADGEAGRVD